MINGMIYEFYELDAGQRGGVLTSDLTRDYDRLYIARSNSPHDREPEVYAHPKCPIPQQTKASWDNLAICTSVEARFRPKSRWTWLVAAKFSSGPRLEAPRKINPWDEDAIVTCETETIQKEKYVGRNRNVLCSTAGGIMKRVIDVPQLVFQVTKNVPTVSGWLNHIQGVVNSDPVRLKGLLYQPGYLKVTKARVGEDDIKNDIPFMKAYLEIRYDEDGWDSVALNQDWYELVDVPPEKPGGKPGQRRERCRTGDYILDTKNGQTLIIGTTGEPEETSCFLDADGKRPREWYKDQGGTWRLRPKVLLDPSDIVFLRDGLLTLFPFASLPLT